MFARFVKRILTFKFFNAKTLRGKGAKGAGYRRLWWGETSGEPSVKGF